MLIVLWSGLLLDAAWFTNTLTQAPPVRLERTSTSPFSACPSEYQRKYWSNSSVTDVAVERFITGVMSCSSCVAPVPALSLSTIATGETSGDENARAPGFAVVQVDAAPPPVPPSTMVHVAAIPPVNGSLSAVPVPGVTTPTAWALVDVTHGPPSFAEALTLNVTVVPHARLDGSFARKLTTPAAEPVVGMLG